jgi:hypothetical protein
VSGKSLERTMTAKSTHAVAVNKDVQGIIM